MKRLFVITTVAVMAATTTIDSARAYDWSSRTAFTAEWQQQSARIKDGQRSGMLARAEARMLRRELDALGGMTYNSKTREMLSRHSKKIAAYKSGSGN